MSPRDSSLWNDDYSLPPDDYSPRIITIPCLQVTISSYMITVPFYRMILPCLQMILPHGIITIPLYMITIPCLQMILP